MTKIISALALLAVLAAASSSCSSNKAKAGVETDSLTIEEFATVATDSVVDSIPTDSTSLSQELSIESDWISPAC